MRRIRARAGVKQGTEFRVPEIRLVLMYAAAFLLCALLLAPILQSGFIGDDTYNSSTWSRSAMQVDGQGLIEAAFEDQKVWVTHYGRFFPMTAYTYVVFHLVNGDAPAYKALIFALVLLDVGLLAVLVRRLSGSDALSGLTLALVPTALQFRSLSYEDPILAYAGLLQVVAALTLGSLILLVIYLDRAQRRFLVASLVLYGLSLVTYEISLALFPLHFLIVWLYPKRESLRKSLKTASPYAILAVITATTAVGLRLVYGAALTNTSAQYASRLAVTANVSEGSYAPNFAPAAILTTIAKQVVASFPLSYRLIAPDTSAWMPSFVSALYHSPKGAMALVAGYTTVVLMICLQVWRERVTGRLLNWQVTLCVGAGLVVLPQVLISLSPRYQAEVFWGVGYLPVYFGSLGIAAVLAVGIYSLLRVVSPRGRVPFLVVAALVIVPVVYTGVVNFYSNQTVVELRNRDSLYPRVAVSQAIDHGLFREVPSDATLVLGTPHNWESEAFYEGESGLPIEKVIAAAQLPESLPSNTSVVNNGDGSSTYRLPSTSTLYFVANQGYWQSNGFAVSGKIRQFVVRPGQTTRIHLDPAFLYETEAPRPDGQTKVPTMPQKGLPAVSGEIGFSEEGLIPLSSESSWSLRRTRPGQSIWLEK